MGVPRETADRETPTARAWYEALIPEFLTASPESIIGRVATNSDFPDLQAQKLAWAAEIKILKECLGGLEGALFLEFSIPRMGRRVDAVVLVGPIVFVLEFKVGDSQFRREALDQIWDYALDLKNFHEASHTSPIIPVLVATEAAGHNEARLEPDHDKVYRPVPITAAGLRGVLYLALRTISGEALSAETWSRSPYHPTPTIVEAACSLYSQHSVDAIAAFDAGKENLKVTSRRIEELVEEAAAARRKVICFVTGVPGAGKTLVGLNIATRRREADKLTHAVFLSGNGPLVAVLREALARD